MTMNRRHPVDYLSLAFGLLYTATALVLLFGDLGALSWEWIGPVAIIALGGIVILTARPRGETSADA